MSLVDLLRNNGAWINEMLKVKYDKDYDSKWTDEELLEHIVQLNCSLIGLSLPDLPNCKVLNCSFNQLTQLPKLPNCQILDCYDNQLTQLPKLPNCVQLNCSNNQITQLPELPNCTQLNCDNNQLTQLPELSKCQRLRCCNNQLAQLPELPNCIQLYCYNNQLIQLPALPNCITIECENNQLTQLPELLKCERFCCYNNPLIFSDFKSFQQLWRFKRFYLSLKYIRLMYKRMLAIKKNNLRELHLELKYSPDLKFYKEDEYYLHFINQQRLMK